jgi:hypothetical protein
LESPMNVIQQLQMKYHVFEQDLITISVNSLSLGWIFSTWGDPLAPLDEWGFISKNRFKVFTSAPTFNNAYPPYRSFPVSEKKSRGQQNELPSRPKPKPRGKQNELRLNNQKTRYDIDRVTELTLQYNQPHSSALTFRHS